MILAADYWDKDHCSDQFELCLDQEDEKSKTLINHLLIKEI